MFIGMIMSHIWLLIDRGTPHYWPNYNVWTYHIQCFFVVWSFIYFKQLLFNELVASTTISTHDILDRICPFPNSSTKNISKVQLRFAVIAYLQARDTKPSNGILTRFYWSKVNLCRETLIYQWADEVSIRWSSGHIKHIADRWLFPDDWSESSKSSGWWLWPVLSWSAHSIVRSLSVWFTEEFRIYTNGCGSLLRSSSS
jgi:hypothetical protein